ncbi:hypothetical protein CspeluHIS016_0902950 [Cutaneotrichosporon spelunceum]|uniref:Transmembrane protein n=1 Tax=Cutaneotrichosporon spelunceum TaxID=1672016 RepID=A0AAD3U0A2_9TREE|nr:hypothetical protein CspeluHIS016_0902950 [Cutaneotrichosporon spelunceum]
MPRSKKSPRRSPFPSPAAPKEAEEKEMVLSGLKTSSWFPFFFLAFACLGAFFSIVAWSFPYVQNGDYRYVPLLLAGIGGMILSPVIGHFLSTAVLECTDTVGRWLLHSIKQEDEDAGMARGLVFVLAVLVAVLVWLVVMVRDLCAETATLRREIAYVALRDAQAHESKWF